MEVTPSPHKWKLLLSDVSTSYSFTVANYMQITCLWSIELHAIFFSPGPTTDYRSGTGTAVEQIPDNNDDHVPSTAAANSDDQETNQLLTKKEIKLIQKKVRLF